MERKCGGFETVILVLIKETLELAENKLCWKMN